MTNSKEVLLQFRDQLELEIKDTFLWVGDWTKLTNRNDKNSKRTGTQCPTVMQIVHFIPFALYPRKNVQHIRADFFDQKRETNETAADKWKRILDVEKKCEFETITAAALIASKFLSPIGKSAGDYELKKKIRKSDMSVEAVTNTIHECMYEKLNESPETEEKKKTRHVDKKLTNSKEQTERYPKTRRLDCTLDSKRLEFRKRVLDSAKPCLGFRKIARKSLSMHCNE